MSSAFSYSVLFCCFILFIFLFHFSFATFVFECHDFFLIETLIICYIRILWLGKWSHKYFYKVFHIESSCDVLMEIFFSVNHNANRQCLKDGSGTIPIVRFYFHTFRRITTKRYSSKTNSIS